MAPVDGSMLCRKQIYRILQVFKKADLCSMYLAVQWSWFAWVNAFCNLSHKKLQKVTVSLLGWFLSRHCFTLCITMEVESRIAKQYKCHHCCSCKKKKKNGQRGWRMEKSVFVSIFGWPKDPEFVIFFILGHPIAWATSYCVLPDTFLLQASKNAFKVGSVKFANSLSPPSIGRMYAPEVKAAKGLKQCQAEVKGVNNPA